MGTLSAAIAAALSRGLLIAFRRDHERADVFHLEMWNVPKPDSTGKAQTAKRAFTEEEFRAHDGRYVVGAIDVAISEFDVLPDDSGPR